ncbi:MAG: HAD family hydrolase [Candidatus Binataceae bacterium]
MTIAAHPPLWLFDFDSTLARLDPEVDWPTLRAEVRKILERAHAPRGITQKVPLRALAMYEDYRAYLERTPAARAGGAAALARVALLIEQFELAGVDRAKPLAGACDLLRAIAALKLRIGIVTSNSSVTVMRWLSRYRVAETVGFVVGRDSNLALKPSPATLKRGLEIAGVRARDAIFVGDREDDLHAARRARIRFVGVAADRPARDRLVTAGASEIYSSPAALAIHLNLAAARQLGGARASKPRARKSHSRKSIVRKSRAV